MPKGIRGFQKGHVSWNKGLTKENYKPLMIISEKMKKNNSFDNLVLLCKTCHRTLHNFINGGLTDKESFSKVVSNRKTLNNLNILNNFLKR